MMGADGTCLSHERTSLFLSPLMFSDFEALLPAGASELATRVPLWKVRRTKLGQVAKKTPFSLFRVNAFSFWKFTALSKKGKGQTPFHKKKGRGFGRWFLLQVFSELLNTREQRVRERTKTFKKNKNKSKMKRPSAALSPFPIRLDSGAIHFLHRPSDFSQPCF